VSDSIKKQICARIQSNLEALGPLSNGPFKVVARKLDPMQIAQVMPSLYWRPGAESQLGNGDTQGRTYTFPLVIVTHFKGADKVEQHDDLVAAIQDAVEGDLQLNGLANVLVGGTEDPWIDEQANDVGGSVIIYTVEYRRRRGAADQTY